MREPYSSFCFFRALVTLNEIYSENETDTLFDDDLYRNNRNLINLLNQLSVVEILTACGKYSRKRTLPQNIIDIVQQKMAENIIPEVELSKLFADGGSFIPSLAHYIEHENYTRVQTYSKNWVGLAKRYFTFSISDASLRESMLEHVKVLKNAELYNTAMQNSFFRDNHGRLLYQILEQINAGRAQTPEND